MENPSIDEGVYQLPTLAVNESGWGPSSIPEQFDCLPFSLFSPDDNLGMIVELTGAGMSRHASAMDGEGGDFTVVETSRTAAPRKTKLLHSKTNRTYNTSQTNNANASTPKTRSQQKKSSTQYQRRNYDALHISSIPVKSTWKSVYQEEFSDLAKLTIKKNEKLPESTVFADCGCCNIYNNTYDSMNIKKTVALESHPEAGDLKSVSVLKDPFIMQVAEKKIASVYTTDVALSYIMAVTHSQLSWDLEIVKNEKGIFISHRDNAFDLLHVNETSSDIPTEEENKDDCLRKEATEVNRDFAKQIMTSEIKTGQYPSPFDEDTEDNQEKLHHLYRYKKFTFSGSNDGAGKTLLIRTSIHGIQKKGDRETTFTNYAINEWCSRVPLANRWRNKMASSTSYPLIEDMKNNNFRLLRWGVQSVLAGVDNVKIGYVTRKNMNVLEDGHNLLYVQSFSLDSFTKQIMLNQNSMWAITEHIINVLEEQEDGHYIMLKDPIKGMIRIYKVSEEDLTKIEEGEEEEEEEKEKEEYSGSEYSGSEYSGSEYSGSEYSGSEYSEYSDDD